MVVQFESNYQPLTKGSPATIRKQRFEVLLPMLDSDQAVSIRPSVPKSERMAAALAVKTLQDLCWVWFIRATQGHSEELASVPERVYRSLHYFADDAIPCVMHRTDCDSLLKMMLNGIGICPGDSAGRMTHMSSFPLDAAEYVSGSRDSAPVEYMFKKR